MTVQPISLTEADARRLTEATIAHEHVRDAVLAELDATLDAVVLQIMATQIAAARQQVTR